MQRFSLQRPFFAILLAVALIGVLLPVVAQDATGDAAVKSKSDEKAPAESKDRKSKSAPEKRPGRVSLTPAREAAAMTFARLHHPELADLLVKLKTRKARQYDQAVRQLFQTSERLARARDRSPERHELELDAWKLDSRIRLLAARMTMNSDTKRDEELKSLLKDRAELRLRQLTNERQRLAERIDRIDALIERMGSDPDASTLKEFQRIKRSFAAKGPRARKGVERPVVAPNPRPSKSREKAKNRL